MKNKIKSPHFNLRLPMDEAGITVIEINELKALAKKSGLPLDRLINQILKRYLVSTKMIHDLTMQKLWEKSNV